MTLFAFASQMRVVNEKLGHPHSSIALNPHRRAVFTERVRAMAEKMMAIFVTSALVASEGELGFLEGKVLVRTIYQNKRRKAIYGDSCPILVVRMPGEKNQEVDVIINRPGAKTFDENFFFAATQDLKFCDRFGEEDLSHILFVQLRSPADFIKNGAQFGCSTQYKLVSGLPEGRVDVLKVYFTAKISFDSMNVLKLEVLTIRKDESGKEIKGEFEWERNVLPYPEEFILPYKKMKEMQEKNERERLKREKQVQAVDPAKVEAPEASIKKSLAELKQYYLKAMDELENDPNTIKERQRLKELREKRENDDDIETSNETRSTRTGRPQLTRNGLNEVYGRDLFFQYEENKTPSVLQASTKENSIKQANLPDRTGPTIDLTAPRKIDKSSRSPSRSPSENLSRRSSYSSTIGEKRGNPFERIYRYVVNAIFAG